MSFKKIFAGKPTKSFDHLISQLELVEKTNFVKMEQVHGNLVAEVKREGLVFAVDACFTAHKNLFLSVKSADCLPILISGFGYKKQKIDNIQIANFEFVAAAHAGRKGTNLKILAVLLDKLQSKYNIVHALKINNQILNVWLGPAICEKCYQIDTQKDIHYNLIEENKKQLFEFFTKHNLEHQQFLNLEIENHCTLHEPEKYYSYRATGPGVKMNYSLIGII